jgi:Tol biopolymer transport system component
VTTDLSPDGSRAAVVRTVQGNTDIWIVDSTRMTRFTFDPGTEFGPVWSPDGRYIVFDSDRSGKRNLYRKSLADTENEELLLESDQNKMANQWSPDGRFLFYDTVDATTGYDLWLLPFGGDRRPSLFLKTKFLERDAQLSPDGKWMAYRSSESGTFEIYVRPFPGPGRPWQISTQGGFVPRWRADGKELYYISLEGKMMAVSIGTRGGALEPGPPVSLFQTQIVGGGTPLLRREYAVAGDGRFLINTFVDEAAPITLLLNWNPQAK